MNDMNPSKLDLIHELEHNTALAPYAAALAQAARPFVGLRVYRDDKVKPWQSSLCGLPYAKQGEALPRMRDGRPMFMVAQINFAEVSPVLPGFPTQGMLQFWISELEDGIDDESQLIWVPKPIASSDELLDVQDYMLHVESLEQFGGFFAERRNSGFLPAKIHFEPGWMLPSLGDRDGELMVKAILGTEYEKLWGTYWNVSFVDKYDHWLGGFAEQVHNDPREEEDTRRVLLSLGSDSTDQGSCIQWGDVGTAAWYMTMEALQRRDFSDVLYNWDCH